MNYFRRLRARQVEVLLVSAGFGNALEAHEVCKSQQYRCKSEMPKFGDLVGDSDGLFMSSSSRAVDLVPIIADVADDNDRAIKLRHLRGIEKLLRTPGDLGSVKCENSSKSGVFAIPNKKRNRTMKFQIMRIWRKIGFLQENDWW